MSRVDDLRDTCEESYSRNVSLARMNTLMFIDIAKSLAVIADEISGEQPKESQGEILEDFIGHLASEMKEKFETGWCDCSVNEMIEFIREQAGWEKDL
jgi:hypothetical protein